jgi:hypothetical protein
LSGLSGATPECKERLLSCGCSRLQSARRVKMTSPNRTSAQIGRVTAGIPEPSVIPQR